jgi:hypothetical protein
VRLQAERLEREVERAVRVGVGPLWEVCLGSVCVYNGGGRGAGEFMFRSIPSINQPVTHVTSVSSQLLTSSESAMARRP